MAFTVTYSNHFKAQLWRKQIDIVNDTIKICLMGTGFVFNKDSHATWADVSASELASGAGYTQNTKTMSFSITENDSSDSGDALSVILSWLAGGGYIGPTPGAIIYDDSTSDNTVIAYIDFGADQTAPDGTSLTIGPTTLKIS